MQLPALKLGYSIYDNLPQRLGLLSMADAELYSAQFVWTLFPPLKAHLQVPIRL